MIHRVMPNGNMTLAGAKRLVSKWPVVALDTETTSLNIFTADLITLQLGNLEDQIVIDCRYNDVSVILKEVNKKKIILQNAAYDYNVLRNSLGIELNDMYDTMLVEKLLTNGKDLKYGLDEIARRRTDPYAYTNQGNLFYPVVSKKVRDSFSKLSPLEDLTEEQITYGALDVYYTYAIYLKQMEEAKRIPKLIQLECDFVKVSSDIHYNGIKLDVDDWMGVNAKAQEGTFVLLGQLIEIADINWDSPKQVKDVFKSAGINTTFLDTKTGELKDSVSVLALSKSNNPLVATYLAYKKSQKKVSTYGVKFLNNINRLTGRVHTSIFPLQDTGRTSSNGPNMQNIPRSGGFRECFKPEEGNVFVIADFSNQELRVVADLAREKTMIDAFRAKKDLHLVTASMVYGEEITDKEDPRRNVGKTVSFLTLFGGGAGKLAAQFNLKRSEATRVIDAFFKGYPQLAEWIAKAGEESKAQGYIDIDKYGRRYYFPYYEEYLLLKSEYARFRRLGEHFPVRALQKLEYYEAEMQRKSQNYKVQGTAATMSKIAGVLLWKASKELDFKIILTIHDEWMLECSKKLSKKVKIILEEKMLEASWELQDALPVPASAVITSNWQK